MTCRPQFGTQMCRLRPPLPSPAALRHYDVHNLLSLSNLRAFSHERKLQALANVFPESIAKARRLFRLLYLTIKRIVTHTRSGSALEQFERRQCNRAVCRDSAGHSGGVEAGAVGVWRAHRFCLASELMRRVS